ncbi:hypothetical protein GCM10007094_41320 [Pseudovibrio japonicus]|uniref:Uncharacterized protein n=1 Tax=Pseudovibrio japonicus TaxID=366534 RepID=A0ABQ3EN41_9HYPH|nr:hypothetical protein [Pseudovibrio japonicus]GHB47759.1 hypothetical protein GCM10007094_41320 [Pseudovibrio japonicus]
MSNSIERVGKIADRFKWCMHVVGPDDVIPAESYAAALKMADEHNAHYIASMERTDVCTVAVPAIWPWSEEDHAEQLSKQSN